MFGTYEFTRTGPGPDACTGQDRHLHSHSPFRPVRTEHLVIYEGSRYEDERVVRVVDHIGQTQPAIYVRPDIDYQFFYFGIYVTREGDRLDLLAHRFFNDPERWYMLARANPEVFYPEDIAVGTVLRVPHG